MNDIEIRNLFSRISKRYDFLNHFLSINFDKYWRRVLIEHAAPRESDKILDVCTGTCDVAIKFAQRGFSVVSVDFSEEMLKVGKQKIKKRGLEEKIRLILCDALNLPFKNDVFDIVTITFGLRNIEDWRVAIREMIRVTRRGGKVFMLEFSLPQNFIFYSIYQLYLKKVLPFIGGVISGSKSAYMHLPESIFKFDKEVNMLELLEEEGLKNLYRKKLTAGVVSLYIGKK